jgi:hypothetical protein
LLNSLSSSWATARSSALSRHQVVGTRGPAGSSSRGGMGTAGASGVEPRPDRNGMSSSARDQLVRVAPEITQEKPIHFGVCNLQEAVHLRNSLLFSTKVPKSMK